jgi:hypothetical protein
MRDLLPGWTHLSLTPGKTERGEIAPFLWTPGKQGKAAGVRCSERWGPHRRRGSGGEGPRCLGAPAGGLGMAWGGSWPPAHGDRRCCRGGSGARACRRPTGPRKGCFAGGVKGGRWCSARLRTRRVVAEECRRPGARHGRLWRSALAQHEEGSGKQQRASQRGRRAQWLHIRAEPRGRRLGTRRGDGALLSCMVATRSRTWHFVEQVASNGAAGVGRVFGSFPGWISERAKNEVLSTPHALQLWLR